MSKDPPSESKDSLGIITRDLRQRVRELDCLYGISHLVERSGGSLPSILQGTVEILPSSWEFPETTCARIILEDKEFTTPNFRPGSPWSQKADIYLWGEKEGSIEVCYREEHPEQDEGPFLKEERQLIDSIALRIGRISERIRTAEKLKAQEDELRARLTHLSRVSTLGEMASSIAHEVNQPLTAIATYAQAGQRFIEGGSEGLRETTEILEKISTEALRAGDIIHRLKDLIRKEKTQRRTCVLNDLVRGVENLAEVDARLNNVQLALDLGDGLPRTHANCIQIQQVILNLIRNGIDAMEDTPIHDRVLFIITDSDGSDTVRLRVTDRGEGVSEEARESLFTPFFTTKKNGLGMGLSISRSIISSHGGEMGFQQNPAGGSTFFFTLPTLTEDLDG